MYDAVIKEQWEKGIVQIVDNPVIRNGDRTPLSFNTTRLPPNEE